MKACDYEIVFKNGSKRFVGNIYKIKEDKRGGIHFENLNNKVAFVNRQEIVGYFQSHKGE